MRSRKALLSATSFVMAARNRDFEDLRVDASGGTEVDEGEVVHRGQPLGYSSSGREKLCSPIDGVVVNIEFEPGTHEHVITIESSGA